jgi:hypothetical protein
MFRDVEIAKPRFVNGKVIPPSIDLFLKIRATVKRIPELAEAQLGGSGYSFEFWEIRFC